MKTTTLILAIILCFALVIESKSQEKISINQFAWLTGHWVGDGFGGVSEEVWSQPMGGAMIGTYRHLSEGKNNFYEFMQINEENGSIKLRLKHFNPDMKGWEEKEDFVDFPFISVEEGKAVFKGLIYELVNENSMKISLELHNKEKTWTEVFNFKRKESLLLYHPPRIRHHIAFLL